MLIIFGPDTDKVDQGFFFLLTSEKVSFITSFLFLRR